jgi:hypothetical protein
MSLLNSNTKKALLIVFIPILLIVTCNLGNQYLNNQKEDESNVQKELDETLKKKLYYHVPYGEYSRFDANLIGAYGIVEGDFRCEKNNGRNVEVIDLNAKKHDKSRPSYKGFLLCLIENSRDTIEIDYDCFKPDYTRGDWLK